MPRHLSFRNLLTGLAVLVFAAPAAAQRLAPIDLDAALPAAEVERALVARAPGTPLNLRGLRDTAGTPMTLELRRVEVLTPEFQLLVDGQRADFDRDSIVFLAGRVTEWQGSTAVLSLQRERGVYEGVIRQGERTYRLTGDALGKRSFGEQMLVTELPLEIDEWQRKSELVRELPRPKAAPDGAFTKVARTAVFAVDGDYEFFTVVGSQEAAVTFSGTILAAISEVYESQVGLAIKLGIVSVWTTPDDPYKSSDNPFCEVGTFWEANRPRQLFPRAAALLFSGKTTVYGGAASLHGLCAYASGDCKQGPYAVMGHVKANVPALHVDTTAHEIGHLAGSVHSHCYSPPIDQCHSGENGCYAGPTSTPADGGSIMSYCNSFRALSLGEPGKHGVNSERVPAVISEFLAALNAVPADDPQFIAGCLAGASGYGLQATAQGTTVALSWADNQTGEKKWVVEYRQGTTGGWKKLARPANATAASVTKLVPGKTYQFRVRAQLKKGFSPYSEVVQVKIP